MTTSNQTLLLTSNRGTDAGSTLFWSDGTTVTEIGYYDSNPNTLFPTSAVSLNGIEYINMVDTTTGSYAIWAYNGATTTQITPSADYVNTYNDTNAAFASSFTEFAYNNTLVFSEATLASNAVGDDAFDSASLAVYDPTTGLVTQPSVPNGGLDPQDFATIGSTLYFEGFDTSTNAEAIYSFDGTTVTEIYNLHPTSNSGAGSVTGPMVAFNNNLYFGSNDETIYELTSLTSLSNSAANRSGSTASANQIADTGLVVAGNFLYFANQANGIYSLSTTNVLTRVLASSGGSIGFQPVNWNGQLYFFGGSGTQKFYTSTGAAATLSNSSVTGSTLDFVPLGSDLYFNRNATTQQYFNGTSVGAIAVPGNLGGVPLAVLPFTPTGWAPAVVPVTLTGGASGTYNKGGTPVAVDPGLTITDTASNTLTSALVAITNLSFKTGDMLNFTNQNGIVGTYDANTGLLALNGSATVAQYQAALASVTFNITGSVGGSSRTFDFAVGDNENNNSVRVTSTVNTSNTVVAPTVTEALVGDTGSSSSDNITSNDAVTGTGNPSAVVTITEGATTLGTTTANTLGNWTFSAYSPALAQGSNTIVATETNSAGSGSATLTFTLDTTPPTASSIDTIGAPSNTGGTEQFAVTFSESVTGVDTSDFALANTGGVTGTINSISGSGASYTVTVTGASGTGTMGLNLNGSGTGITDIAGNAISGGFTAGQTFSIGPASGTPSISAPSTATVGIGETGQLGTVTIAESPTTGGETFTAVLSDTQGQLSATTGAVGGGGTVSAPGTTLTISGTLAEVNADLTTLADNDATTPSDTISIILSDSNDGNATPAAISVTVNGSPSLSVPASAALAQNTTAAISPVTLSETGNTTTSGETFTVTLTDTNGLLAANTGAADGGGTVSTPGTTLTISGTLAQVNADLGTLTDDDPSAGSDTISVSATDSFGNSAGSMTIPVSVAALSNNAFDAFVYLDSNGDGVMGGAETGLPGVTVNLLDGSGNPTGQSLVTDASGVANFTGLAAGTYEIGVVTPPGDVVSQASNIDLANPLTGGETVNATEGVYAPATFSLHVYDDVNANGTQDAGDINAAGITVSLLDGFGNPTGKSTTTDSNGNASFTGLAPGSYEVAVINPPGDAATQTTNLNTANLLASGGSASATGGFYAPPALIQPTISLTDAEGQSLSNLWSTLIANGIDPNPASLTITAAGLSGTAGAVNLNAGTQTLTYLATGFNPSSPVDAFTYTLKDGSGGTVTGTVDVTITGANLPTTVATTPGSTTTATGGGQRLISEGTGQTLNGSASGGDLLFGGSDTTIHGAGNNNIIYVTPGNHVITMGASNNTATLYDGNNSVSATGTGNTVTGGNGNNAISGMTGTATITLGNGNNTITITGAGNKVTVGDGKNNISAGTAGNETVIAGNGANTISAGGSNDKFTAGDGANKITASGGSATIVTGNGGSTIAATGTGDSITTGSGNDTITVTAGSAVIKAGLGTNSIKFAGSNNDIINQGGTDTLTDNGTNNTIAVPFAGQGLDTINGSVLSNGDTFDLRSALAATTWDQQLSDLGNYLSLGTSGSNALVQLSVTSGGTPITIAVLNGQGSVSLGSFVTHALLT
jgi:hypothetical protein